MTYYTWGEKIAIFQNELLHSSCFMPPFLAVSLVFIVLTSLLLAITVIPQAFIGFLLAMIISHGNFMKLLIEHLYPTNIGKWVHFKLLAGGNQNGTRKQHSRTIEHRVEVIPGILYIHMISQFMDNLCYLIVHLDYSKPKLQGIVIDCGDATALLPMIEQIHRHHYHDQPDIEVMSVLCTHKHHDHTAGNKGILKAFPDVKIFGGAVERVPYANELVKHDTILSLPLPANASIRAIAVPSHTRGSLIYQLTTNIDNSTYLFSGDTVFLGGGGDAFEAHNNIATTISRCFAEVLVNVSDPGSCMLFPGHEYSRELLSMQFIQNNDSKVPAKIKNWSDFNPHDFFATAGQYLVATHRRGLPPGKRLLTIPGSLHHEIIINPQFRILRKSGENALHALRLWYQNRGGNVELYASAGVSTRNPQEVVQSASSTTPSTALSWNLTQKHVNHNVFTTFYSADLDALIQGLQSSSVTANQAAMHLKLMSDKMKMSLTPRSYSVTDVYDENDDNSEDASKRHLFSHDTKLMKDAISALVVLGSPPTALTVSDSKQMGLPQPYMGKLTANDHLLISRSRLLKVLEAMSLLQDPSLRQIIDAFFDDAFETKGLNQTKAIEPSSATESVRIMNEAPKVYEACIEASGEKCVQDDAIELGYLKFTLFGQLLSSGNSSWWSFLCKPCNNSKANSDEADENQITRKGNEAVGKGPCKLKITPLVYHDMSRCFMCKDSLACPLGWSATSQTPKTESPPVEEGVEMDEESAKGNGV